MTVSDGGAAVRIRGFGWRYAGRKAWACRGVDLDVAAGERVLLVGPSGAGKSTLLRAVAGLLDPETAAEQEGSVLVDGVPAAAARDRVGMLLQDPEASLVMSRSGDDVAFGLENAGVPADEIWPRVDESLARVGFRHGRDRPTAALSGGEQQRLALAGALVRRPSVLVLDEPTANLDPDGTATVLGAVAASLSGAGTTLLLVEHRVDAAAGLVDRVVVLEPGGGVLDDGPPEEVFGRRGAALAAAGVWVPAPWGPAAPPFRPGPGGDVVLTAADLTLTYPRTRRPALSSASLTVRHGTAVAVTGPNGSGKSTLAMLLAGLLPPDTGSVLLGGSERPLHRWRARDLCRRVGTVFQDPEHQFVTRTARDELLVGPRRAGVAHDAAQRRADELLERLRLTRLAGANPFTLSGGEKRRLSVAAMLTTAPDLLVLDEPTFGQDARTWAELLELLVRLRVGGTAIVAVTHDEAFAGALADARVTVSDGALRDVVEVRS
ncbi:ABC transporter ATP-binding protein [Jiangella alba]|uniref:Energy-coupling factor transport system ATP-binding protein n=1 Tax=Jiangella alba TaxID=561176 RepID=A0A1H5PVE1_9ACTN|nr:ATP-binding cassette domain-containing protein [Jiangella alba]SEF17822.1 energy-coupling factor transport system ATP-binding protein [Jiangella alba]